MSASGSGHRHDTRGFGAGERRAEKRRMMAEVAREQAAADPEVHARRREEHASVMENLEAEMQAYKQDAYDQAMALENLQETHTTLRVQMAYLEQETMAAEAMKMSSISEANSFRLELGIHEYKLAESRVALRDEQAQTRTLRSELAEALRSVGSHLLIAAMTPAEPRDPRGRHQS
jgi:hypothetical protein